MQLRGRTQSRSCHNRIRDNRGEKPEEQSEFDEFWKAFAERSPVKRALKDKILKGIGSR